MITPDKNIFKVNYVLKFMAWFSAFVTIGFIVLMVFDYG